MLSSTCRLRFGRGLFSFRTSKSQVFSFDSVRVVLVGGAIDESGWMLGICFSGDTVMAHEQRNCNVNGCERSVLTRGMCSAHYQKWRLKGDPLAVGSNLTHGHSRSRNGKKTRKEQNRNRRSSDLITVGDRTQCLSAWVEESGNKRSTIKNRLARGWDPQRAVFTPPKSVGLNQRSKDLREGAERGGTAPLQGESL